MPQREVVTLTAVHCEGLYLRVRDGRTLMINPDDARLVRDWSENLKLTIDDTGVTTVFHLQITCGDESVRATWV